MDGLYWVLIVGVTGWLTGKMVGEMGYGKALGGYADGLDIILGVVGAVVGVYLFFWAVVGEGTSFSRYATSIVGAITLVGGVRLVSAKYLPASSR